jgi:hypothetical protein
MFCVIRDIKAALKREEKCPRYKNAAVDVDVLFSLGLGTKTSILLSVGNGGGIRNQSPVYQQDAAV